MWVLKNGSSDTAMGSFIPDTLTEEETWKITLYVHFENKENFYVIALRNIDIKIFLF